MTRKPMQWVAILSLFNLATGDIFATTPPQVNETMHMEKLGKLQKKLFSNYTRNVRPVHNQTTCTTIRMQLTVQHLQVDEVYQTMTVHGSLYLQWNDEFLHWDPSEYADQTVIHVPLWYLWMPDINVLNSAAGVDIWSIADEFPATISSYGSVQLQPEVTFKVRCPFDYSNYPNDVQTCLITLGSYRYSFDELNVVYTPHVLINMAWDETNQRMGRRHVNGWKLVRESVTHLFYAPNGVQLKHDPNLEDHFALVFNIGIERHSPYYHVLFLMPSVITSVITIFVFLIKRPKMQLMTSIMSIGIQGIFLKTMIPRLPQAGQSGLRIVTYYNLNFYMTFLAVLLVLALASLANLKDPVPSLLEQAYNSMNWFEPSKLRNLLEQGCRNYRFGHKRFQNGNDDEFNVEKEEVPNIPSVTFRAVVEWRNIFDWLCRNCFVLYAVVYIIAMLSLLT